MKKTMAGIVLAVLIFGWGTVGAVVAPHVGIFQYGLHCNSEQADCVPRFLVTVGEMTIVPERVARGSFLGFLAQGVMWVNRGEVWETLEYRLPAREDFKSADLAEFFKRLEIRKTKSANDLPEVIRSLSPEALENIEGFIAFYGGKGALRIYIREDSERSAQNLSQALRLVPGH